eukprot:7216223-Prymnesium_polylepis.1
MKRTQRRVVDPSARVHSPYLGSMSGRVADASDPPRPRRRGRDPSARHAWAAVNAYGVGPYQPTTRRRLRALLRGTQGASAQTGPRRHSRLGARVAPA